MEKVEPSGAPMHDEERWISRRILLLISSKTVHFGGSIYCLNLCPGEIHALSCSCSCSQDLMPRRVFPAPGHQKTSLSSARDLALKKSGIFQAFLGFCEEKRIKRNPKTTP